MRQKIWMVLVVICVWRCASVEPGSDDFTSLTPGTVPVSPSTASGNDTPPNESTDPNNTTSTSVPTPTQLGFVGKPANGFSLQSIELPGFCLATREKALVAQTPYVLSPCQAHPSQLFYWALGTFAQTASLCMTAQHASGGVFNLANCPSSPPSGQYSSGTSGAIWLLSENNNTLYTNGNNSESGTWTVGSPSAALSANSPLEVKELFNAQAVAHLAITTQYAGATHIYLQDSNGNRCLTESNNVATLTSCAEVPSQLWRLEDHAMISNSGLCLTAVSATAGSSTNLQGCSSSNQQQKWFIAAGAIGLSVPFGNMQSDTLALDLNKSISTTRPSISTMTAVQANWSIGAQNYH